MYAFLINDNFDRLTAYCKVRTWLFLHQSVRLYNISLHCFCILHMICRRATPSMWGASTASLVIKILRNGTPKMINNTLLENLYMERRKPFRGRFYNNSTRKVGLHELKNLINFICDLDFDWLGLDLIAMMLCE